mgnify:CR=1 FL=1
MKTTLPEQKQAEKLLQRNKIQLHDIKSFSFMERYHQAPRKDSRVSKDKYGAGILTLHLIQSADKSIYLTPFRHPTSVIRYLVSNGIPFDNYRPGKRAAEMIVPEKKYCRSSLYMLYFVSLFIAFAVLVAAQINCGHGIPVAVAERLGFVRNGHIDLPIGGDTGHTIQAKAVVIQHLGDISSAAPGVGADIDGVGAHAVIIGLHGDILPLSIGDQNNHGGQTDDDTQHGQDRPAHI